MDEGGVEADATAEESFVAKLDGDVVGVADGAEVDDVERLVSGVIGIADGAGDFAVVAGAAVGGAEAEERHVEAFADFVGDAEGGGEFFPEAFGREDVLDAVGDVAMRVEDFVGRDVPEVEGGEEVGVFLFVFEGTRGGREFEEAFGGFGLQGEVVGRAGGWMSLEGLVEEGGAGGIVGANRRLRMGAEGEEATAGEGGSERSESGHRASFEELSPPQG